MKDSLRDRQPVHERVGIYVGDRYGRHRSVAMAYRIALDLGHRRPQFHATCEHFHFDARDHSNDRRR